MGNNYAVVFVTQDKAFLVYCGKSTGWNDISIELTQKQISKYQKFLLDQSEQKKKFIKSMLKDMKSN